MRRVAGIAPRRAVLLALVGALVAGCSGEPNQIVEDFSWRAGVTELDEAILATCAGRGAIHAVGGQSEGLMLRWSRGRWRAVDAPRTGLLWWCWGDGDELIAVGEGGAVIRGAGEGYVRDPLPPEVAGMTLYGVWGPGDGTLVAVGGNPNLPDSPPVALHYDGEAWSPGDTSALPDGVLFKVWGGGGGAPIWAVGSRGLIARFDGARWTAVPSPTDADLIAVHGSFPGEVFAVGGLGRGELLRFAGGAWELVATTPEELSAVWTAPGEPLYVGGDRGYVARYPRRRGALELDPTAAIVAPDLCVHALFGTGDSVLAAATDLVGGSAAGWRGAIYSTGGTFRGGVVRPQFPDGGLQDASPGDGELADAGDDTGAGESCGMPPTCHPSLTCWYLQASDETLCTRACEAASECKADFGVGACCERPGAQTLTTVCMHGDAPECDRPF